MARYVVWRARPDDPRTPLGWFRSEVHPSGLARVWREALLPLEILIPLTVAAAYLTQSGLVALFFVGSPMTALEHLRTLHRQARKERKILRPRAKGG